jgi:hypothetical protein
MTAYKKLLLVCIALFSCLNYSCTHPLPKITWNYSSNDIIGSAPAKTGNIDLDVYIDATTSMEGFAVSPTSAYSQFLDQLEASALSSWKNANTKFFKFGQIIRPIERNEFLSAKSNSSFYHEQGVYLKTYIDSVVNHTDSSRLSLVVTDLFQDEGDVNVMVESFKNKCFSRGVSVGIIGITSTFNGKVFDVAGFPQGYTLTNKERPFYAVVFGNEYNMQLLFNALKTNASVKDNQFFIISNHIIKSYQTDIKKTNDSKALNNKKSYPDLNSFDFTLKKDVKAENKFNVTVTFDRNTHCADFSAAAIDAVVFRKSVTDPKANSKDSMSSSDISIQNVQRQKNKLTAVLVLKNDEEPGNYSYEVLLEVNQFNGLQLPAWTKDFSTESPIPNQPSGAKTYNLEKLCSRLLVANASVTPTYIAKFFINIYKQ